MNARSRKSNCFLRVARAARPGQFPFAGGYELVLSAIGLSPAAAPFPRLVGLPDLTIERGRGGLRGGQTPDAQFAPAGI